MNPLYNAGISLYKGAARLASISSPKIRKMLEGQEATMDRLADFRRTMAPEGFDVWFHAASLGEFEQARPLIEALLAHRPEFRILLSFFSPSGYEVRHNFNPGVAVVYMPFDSRGAVKAFLDKAEPKMAVFVKYEFWGNYLEELQKRNIPTYLISAIFRPGQIFFKPWGGTFRAMLRSFRHIYVQNRASQALLNGIGVDAVTVAGDTRFDRVTDIRNRAKVIPEMEIFRSANADKFMLAAGSSWGKDEDVYFPVLAKHADVCAVIAPHEFDAARLEHMQNELGKDRTMLFSRFSRLCEESPEKARETATRIKYLIVDSFGLLSSLYRYADAAYVGGGFGAGIHNINEAAVYGIPVAFGPRHQKFNEALCLLACGGAMCIRRSADFEHWLARLEKDPAFRELHGKAAGEYIASNIGATPLILKDLFNLTLT